MKQSYYEILGINCIANQNQIVEAFKKMVKRTDEDLSLIPNKDKEFAYLMAAYVNLSSPSKRKKYNSKLSYSKIMKIEKNYKLYSNAKKMFKKLEENIDNDVTVNYNVDGIQMENKGRLLKVKEFENVKIDDNLINFIGEEHAITKIINNENDEVIYSNPHIKVNYDGNDLESLLKVISESWGTAEAQRSFVKIKNNENKTKNSNDEKGEFLQSEYFLEYQKRNYAKFISQRKLEPEIRLNLAEKAPHFVAAGKGLVILEEKRK